MYFSNMKKRKQERVNNEIMKRGKNFVEGHNLNLEESDIYSNKNLSKTNLFLKLKDIQIGYITNFLQYPDNAEFLKVNKHFRIVILKMNKVLRTLVILINSKLVNEIDILDSPEFLTEKFNDKMSPTELRELVLAYICFYTKQDRIIIKASDEYQFDVDHIVPYYKSSKSILIDLEGDSLEEVRSLVNNLPKRKKFHNVKFNKIAFSKEKSQCMLNYLFGECELRVLKLKAFSRDKNKNEYLEYYEDLELIGDYDGKIGEEYHKNSSNFFDILKTHPTIEKLTLKNLVITSEVIPNLSQMIKLNKKIHSLTFVDCEFEEGDYYFFDYLGYNSTLKKLKIFFNFKNFLLHSFAKHFGCNSKINKINTSLTNLTISYQNFNQKSMEYIGQIVYFSQSIAYLNLENNQISSNMIEYIQEPIKINNTLETLILRKNYIHDFGVECLCKVLVFNKKIQTLDLSINTFTRTSFFYIIEMLKINIILKNIEISLTQIESYKHLIEKQLFENHINNLNLLN